MLSLFEVSAVAAPMVSQAPLLAAALGLLIWIHFPELFGGGGSDGNGEN